MNRLLGVCIAACSFFALNANAQPKTLHFKVSLGGMNIGTFKAMAMPTHVVALAGNDVVITPRASDVDGRPIKLTGGSVSGFSKRVLTPKVGEQMTAEIEVVAVGAGPGKRCTIKLTHAYLKDVTGESLTLRPSSLPTKLCTGDKPPVVIPTP